MSKCAGLLITIFAFLTIPLSAETEKSYCSPEQIELNDSAILVHLDCYTVEVDQLLVDQGGIYFYLDAMRCFYCRRPINPKNICECPVMR